MAALLSEFLIFGIKQARASIFAGSFFALLLLSHSLPADVIPRYDFLFVAAVAIQILLVVSGIETKDEVKVIFVFHLLGLALEIFKTSPEIGSWSYPEAGYLKVFGVPLYSGFMYAAVASYISQSWRIMALEFRHYPSYYFSLPLAGAIYLNFFSHHFLPDIRWMLTAAVFVVFLKTRVRYTVTKKRRQMPLSVAFLLIGFFIWIAENIATFLGAWQYPDQAAGWQVVHLSKISSWFLLVIISVIIVADLKHFKQKRKILNSITE
jgi:uncharacterized membrane protein YoaT (DUF817 family)